jgi:hypothetical protein
VHLIDPPKLTENTMHQAHINLIDADDIAGALEAPGQPLIVLAVDRAKIEANSLQGTLDRLLRLSNLPAHVRKAAQSVELYVSGYDNDRRELSEIPEVRAYFNAITERWPHWWHFATESTRRLMHAMLIECEKVKGPRGRVSFEPNPRALEHYLHRMSRETSDLYRRAGLSQADANATIQRALTDFQLE